MWQLIRHLGHDLNRAMLRPNGQRTVMALCAAVQVFVLWAITLRPGGWWWVQVGCLSFLAAGQWCIERNRRQWRRHDLVMALLAEDPLLWPAQLTYLQGLSWPQVQELAAHMERAGHGVPLDDLPPVLAGYVTATMRTREE